MALLKTIFNSFCEKFSNLEKKIFRLDETGSFYNAFPEKDNIILAKGGTFVQICASWVELNSPRGDVCYPFMFPRVCGLKWPPALWPQNHFCHFHDEIMSFAAEFTLHFFIKLAKGLQLLPPNFSSRHQDKWIVKNWFLESISRGNEVGGLSLSFARLTSKRTNFNLDEWELIKDPKKTCSMSFSKGTLG